MKAVVMAGGEGTRLRPLTSNRPKPLVPVLNKPVMEHIIELLKSHNITSHVSTLYFMPQAIKNYFGTGEDLGIDMAYAVEDSPLGTAGSIKNAEQYLNETFIVISGDALTDLDITKAVEYHKEKGALATLVLKRVENPLDFGVVIANDNGEIERFLEKPGWGQVFSDTINTGIYILEPEILNYIPQDTNFDFSQELFPMLLEKGAPLYGYITDCYWCDIGSIEQFMKSQQDVLSGKGHVNIDGIELSQTIWIGGGTSVDPDARLAGPIVIGENSRIEAGAYIGEYSVIGDNVIVSKDAVVHRSVIMDNCYIGEGTRINGALIGMRCDVKSGCNIEEGATMGDDCVIGENATINHQVKIYPHKTVDAGATVSTNIIWESRGVQTLFGKDCISGLINVDITPEHAVRIGMALGTALPKDSNVIVSRDSNRSARIIKRAILSGINSTGVNCRDLQVAPASLNRFAISSSRALGGVHVRSHPKKPDRIQIIIYNKDGVDIDEATKKSIEKYFFRGEYRRAFQGEIGAILYQSRNREFYVNEMLRQLDMKAITDAQFKVVLDYSYGAVSLLMPSMLGNLGCHAIAVNPYISEEKIGTNPQEFDASLNYISSAVGAFGADLGVLMDSAGERLYIVDDKGRKILPELALMLLLRLACKANGGKSSTVVMPLNASMMAEKIAGDYGVEVVRTKVNGAEIMTAALEPDVLFAGDGDGGYIFPGFVPGYDSILAFCKLLELLAVTGDKLSDMIDDLPTTHILNEEVYCPWEQKGLVMRKLTEYSKEKDLVLLDGVKIMEDGMWTLILPDADDPTVNVIVEGIEAEATKLLLGQYTSEVSRIIKGG